jgi:FlaA1/EpsC-like NDP-sugar epimerase
MTLSSLSNKILSYRIANEAEGRKKYLYLFELFIIGLVYLLSVYAWKRFIEPQLIVDIDFYTFGGINLLLWSIIYKFTVIAKVPRTQRYLQILFQFVRVSFMAGVTLILLKLILGLSSIPFLFILFYISLNLFVIFKMRLLSYVFFKTYRASGHDLHQVIVLADWYSDSFIEKILEEKEWGFNISKVITNSTLIKRKYGKQLEILPESADIKNIIDNEVVDEVFILQRIN